MSKLSSKPTMSVREALDELLRRNEQTQGKEVGDMFLGPDIFVAVLRRRRVVEGEWETTDRTVDLLDLMDQFDSEISDLPPNKSHANQDSRLHPSQTFSA
ncbi:MAG: hypothetical protein R3C44_19330 [Chloroflexota bacterium]